jgi:single-stranded DNA-binding protein
MVAVEGFPSVRGYQNQQGQNAASLDCRVTDLRLLSVPKVQNTETSSQKPLDEKQDDGLPF